MLNNFIYAQTKNLFLEALNAGNILDEAIVFIEDTKEIWNHGHYFGPDSERFQELEDDLSDFIEQWNNSPASTISSSDITNWNSKTSNKGTVTGIKINSSTKNPSNGVVDLGTIITSHQTLKTINNQSIVGSGNITIETGSPDANIQAVETGDVVDDVTIDYATTAYVDELVGDINSVLESIING